ncbi:hypothetical protein CBR_g40787 [Chara braunii]|uniref:Uncharacterized protein n=1 Tax=Chara braunii TaxID=69332 RepID=A0A388LUH9_CHABU|nr:hypothetical protein CBR_g40787 [Chara braunii]|eukprot:GBG85974.1 hypothetical protein CBR_g40787 [Chara braunii]
MVHARNKTRYPGRASVSRSLGSLRHVYGGGQEVSDDVDEDGDDGDEDEEEEMENDDGNRAFDRDGDDDDEDEDEAEELVVDDGKMEEGRRAVNRVNRGSVGGGDGRAARE